MNKFEKLIEYVLNEDHKRAKALFHDIVVEQSRNIYEELQADDMIDNMADELEDDENEIDSDELGIDDDVEDIEDAGDEEDLEDRVMDLEDDLDALKAEFDKLVLDAEDDEDLDMDEDDLADDEDDIDMDEDDLADDEDDIDMDEDDLADDELNLDADEDTLEDDMVHESKGKRKATVKGKSPADLMREYVEKVNMFNNAEGEPVGNGGKKFKVNTKSSVAGPNDMGGTTANIARGGEESDPDGTSPKKPDNYVTKGQTTVAGAGSFQNVPGANTKGYKTRASAKTAEGPSVNSRAVIESKKKR